MTIGVKKTWSDWNIDAVRAVASNSRTRLLALVASICCGAAAVSYAVAPDIVGLLGALLAIIMILIAVFDWRHFIIPNWLNVCGFVLGLVHAGIVGSGAIVQAIEFAIIRGLTTALSFLVLRVLYAAFRGRQGIGLGDVKLAAVAGVWLDWLIIPVAIQIAAFAALSAYLLRQLITGQSISATNRAPFGLFFAPAIWICWLLQTGWLGLF